MNSISYLDSILTRSLTTSRNASGSNTPATEDGVHRLSRRASDYSLSRARDRERKRLSLSLGLSALNADDEPGKRRKSSRSSKRSSRQSSGKNSEAEGGPSERKVRDGLHPKSSSTGAATEGRKRLNRSDSTPAILRLRSSSSAARWSGLWGLGGWLDGSESQDSHTRKGLSHPYENRSKADMTDVDSDNMTSKALRRSSTSDVGGAFASVSPESLLSEREKENVVDFEGYDPEEDLNQSLRSTAPLSTPFPSAAADAISTNEAHRQEGPRPEVSGISTGSRISSLLFGALNPLTDDYFGLQSTLPSSKMKKSEAVSPSGERKRRKSLRLQDAAAKNPSEKAAELLNANGKDVEAASPKEIGVGEPSEPPPPYSDVASTSLSSSLLLPSPASRVVGRAGEATGESGRRAATLLLRCVKRTLFLLRQLILAIFTAPFHFVALCRRGGGRAHALEVELQRRTEGTRQDSESRFQTSSQAERPAAARHIAGRRNLDGRTTIAGYEGSSDEELITEDQAEERNRRKKAQRDAQISEAAAAVEDDLQRKDEAAVEIKTRPRGSSRLLPNPNPIDPLLAHDRDAKPFTALAQASERHPPIFAATMPNRGPLSSLIHHTPKVLVLDLDETLIHSTSRSPTWSVLADKSKGRMAVNTGGSLLGLEGLGGMMGLRGQVGVRPHQVEVVLDGRSIIYHVYKRPHVDYFLRKVAAWYHVVIFTASVQEYADPVIDWLDQGRGLVGTRLFRESCTYRNGSYLKNLAHVDADLSRVCLVDNSPASYVINQGNGIPIEGWTHDPNDECLLDLLPVLDSLRFASDVRHILGLRGFLDARNQASNGIKRS
ncbi:hypothetical protein CBS101457_002014 [Exobasidium rhododendri]|nr:hypothetical protein CBS101457_002014 [Exobasidium rhododendri]